MELSLLKYVINVGNIFMNIIFQVGKLKETPNYNIYSVLICECDGLFE